MFFTINDYKKIEKWLNRNGVKDSDFDLVLETKDKDTIVVLQDNQNKKIRTKRFQTEIIEQRLGDSSEKVVSQITLKGLFKEIDDTFDKVYIGIQDVSKELEKHIKDFLEFKDINEQTIKKITERLGSLEEFRKVVQDKIKEYDKSLIIIKDDIKTINASIESLSSGIEDIKCIVEDLKSITDFLQDHIDTINTIMATLQIQVNDLFIKYEELEKGVKDTENDITRIDASIYTIHKQLQGIFNTLEDTQNKIEEITVALNKRVDKIQEDLDIHKKDYTNPHKVTKAQVGLSNVDNTSDINKPVSTDQETAINVAKKEVLNSLEVTNTSLDNHIKDEGNPHNVTKVQVGLSNLTNDKQVKESEKGVPDGVATLNSKGKIPSSQLPSYVDDVLDVYAVYTKSSTNELSDITLYEDKDHTIPIVGEPGKIYINITKGEPFYQFRWSGAHFINIVGGGLIIGNEAGTAYDGGLGHKLQEDFYHHLRYYNNPHHVTKEQVGLDQADNTSDINKPISIAQANAIKSVKDEVLLKLDNTKKELDNHTEDTSNPHHVTKEQVGLSNVDNTADVDKPLSTEAIAANTEINNKINNLQEQKIDKVNIATMNNKVITEGGNVTIYAVLG